MPVGFELRLLAGKPAAALHVEKFAAEQPDSFGSRIEGRAHLRDAAGIPQHGDTPSAARHGGRMRTFQAMLAVPFPRCAQGAVSPFGCGIGSDDYFACISVDYQLVARLYLKHAFRCSDDCRNPFGAGDDADMARDASAGRHHARDAAEIHQRRIRRRQFLGHDDRSGSKSGERIFGRFARENTAYAAAYVPHVVGAASEVFVVERGEHAAHLFAGFVQSPFGRKAVFRNPLFDLFRQHRVVGHLQVRREDVVFRRQYAQLRFRLRQRGMKAGRFGRRISGRGGRCGRNAAFEDERRSCGNSRRRDSGPKHAHHSLMFAMNAATAFTAAASSPPSAHISISVPHFSPSDSRASMLAALTSFAAVRKVILTGARPLTSFASSPAGRACMPLGAVIVTFCDVI